jgi:predicted ABC-type ATPase
VIVFAGPNGAGKSTAASILLTEGVAFLNADEIAVTLPGYPSPRADLLAGRKLIETMEDFERERRSFAVETTLASRTLAPRIARLRREGYRSELLFLWTPSAEFSIRRVAGRVRLGGHSIPEETIRRRYDAGLRNLFCLFIPIADEWRVFESVELGGPRLVAKGTAGSVTKVMDTATWEAICGGPSDAHRPEKF